MRVFLFLDIFSDLRDFFDIGIVLFNYVVYYVVYFKEMFVFECVLNFNFGFYMALEKIKMKYF